MFYSKRDRLSILCDVKKLIPMLNGTKALCCHEIDDYNHTDFIFGVNACKDVYSKILRFFAKFRS